MRFQVFYRNSMRDAYDHDPPQVHDVAFTHVATLDVQCEDEVDAREIAFRAMNAVEGSDFEVPQKIQNRSMSVGDVVVREIPALPNGLAYVCCLAGWAPVADCDTGSLNPSPDAPTFTLKA
jgi:hypothetical protein